MQNLLTGKRVLVTQATEFMGLGEPLSATNGDAAGC